MKDKKYYTPEIEEFHPGFEYEIYENEYDDRGWREWTFYGNPYHPDKNTFIEGIKNGEIRVKHLDREDIESLGWIHENYLIPDLKTMWYKKPIDDNFSFWIGHGCYKGKTESVVIRAINPNTFFKSEMQGSKVRFQGHLKNKSELKKVLKMIEL